MFDYILAGFTGSFLSYFTVFWVGANIYAFAVDTATDKITRVICRESIAIENKLNQILKLIQTNNDDVLGKNLEQLIRYVKDNNYSNHPRIEVNDKHE